MELVLDRVTKQYGAKLACDRVSARMGPGVYGLLGANGAGKTTLMRMICGVLRPTSGSIRFGGMEVDSEAYRASLGYLPQEFGYYPEFTAQDFLLYLAALKGLPRQQAGLQTEELLELVGLAPQRRKKIRTFSGGMRRRLGIAQALAGQPAAAGAGRAHRRPGPQRAGALPQSDRPPGRDTDGAAVHPHRF